MSDIYNFDFDDDDDERGLYKRKYVICHTGKDGTEESPMFLIDDEIHTFGWYDEREGVYDAKIVYEALKRIYELEESGDE